MKINDPQALSGPLTFIGAKIMWLAFDFLTPLAVLMQK